MSPGIEPENCALNFAKTSTTDYEHLCCLDVLGLVDRQGGNH